MADDEKKKTVRIGCRIVNGITLQAYKHGYDDGTGYRPFVADGPGVVLRGPPALGVGVGSPSHAEAEFTEVDAAWFDAWLETNKDSDLVKNDLVYRDEEAEKK